MFFISLKVSQRAELRRGHLFLHRSGMSPECQVFSPILDMKKAVLPRQCEIPDSAQESPDGHQERTGGIISVSVKPRVNGLEP